MQIHQLKRVHKNKSARQAGRGGKRGKTSGRGTKGQNARAGRKKRPEMRDLIKKLPKLRGRGKNSFKGFQLALLPVNLDLIEKHFAAGDTVSPAILMQKGLIVSSQGHQSKVKILATGEISKKIIIADCIVSGAAKEKIEKAGGMISAGKKATAAK